ncbi:MAG: class I SAM-dependent methyltransferase [Chloroflexales bacterium]|nr:class I SAM-dependent methyltransferase [Chloroflexales bacterium]
MNQQEFLPILEQRVIEVCGVNHPYYPAWSQYYRNRGDRLTGLVKCVAERLPFPIERALVLDIGCGTGSATVELARLGARVIGLDLDQRFGLDLAKIRTQDEPVLALLSSDALRLPFPNGSVDCCFASNAIEHFPDYRQAIAEMQRVTRPGGVVYVETPNKLWPWEAHTQLLFAGWLPPAVAEIYVKLRGKRRWQDRWDVRPLSYWQLRHALERVGLEIRADFPDLIPYDTSSLASGLRRAAALGAPVQWVMPTLKLLALKPVAR